MRLHNCIATSLNEHGVIHTKTHKTPHMNNELLVHVLQARLATNHVHQKKKKATAKMVNNNFRKDKYANNNYLGSKSIASSTRGPMEAPSKSPAAIRSETLFCCST